MKAKQCRWCEVTNKSPQGLAAHERMVHKAKFYAARNGTPLDKAKKKTQEVNCFTSTPAELLNATMAALLDRRDALQERLQEQEVIQSDLELINRQIAAIEVAQAAFGAVGFSARADRAATGD